MRSIPRFFFPIVLTGSLLFSSCSVERKIADKFVREGPEIYIQLFTPSFVYKYNHKGELIGGFDTLTNFQQDSALYADSRFIRYVDDSIFLTRYINSFIDELRALKFKVYLDSSLDTLLSGKPQAYVLNMAQVQLDEYLYPYEESEWLDDTMWTIDFKLNAVDGATWFELSKINTNKPVKTVLYSAFTANDSFEGSFYLDPFSETSVKYHRSKYDTLQVSDLYHLATYMGQKNASYLYDFFLNQYIFYNLYGDIPPQGYFHYNRFTRSLSEAGEERFDVLAP